MRTFNTPAQAKSLREIESASATPVIARNIKNDENTKTLHEQAVREPEARASQETGETEETKAPTQKARKKKHTETV